MSFRRIEDAPDNKTALVRVDFNVPMADREVSDDTRLRAALPTIKALSAKGCKVALLAHFDRPKGKRVPEMSLQPVAPALEKLLGAPVAFADDCIGDEAKSAIAGLAAGGVILLENTRFHKGEEENDVELAKRMASLGDVYINDAFSAAHRAHASTEAIAKLLPAAAGRAMQAELEALQAGLGQPKRPVIAIVGGAKVSTKIELLENLITKVEALVIGGAMANTFIHAMGMSVGKSLAEKDLADLANTILQKAEQARCAIILPIDGTVAWHFEANAPHRFYGMDAIDPEGMVLDVGPGSVERIKGAIDEAGTLVWNGPLGAFEITPFDHGTTEIARYVAARTKAGKLVSVAGGGDTVAALAKAGVKDDLTYVSTAGGAFLEWMEGKPLPGVEALKS